MSEIANNPNGGINQTTDWTKLSGIIFTSPFYTGTTYSQVLCKDGTTQNQTSSPNARILDACRNNGGRAENQQAQSLAVTNAELLKKNMELSAKKDEKMKQLKYGVIAVVLVAGYFAYKKYKK